MAYLISLGLTILTWLGLNVVLTTALLYLGGTVTKWVMLLPLLLVLLWFFLPISSKKRVNKNNKRLFIGLLVSILVSVVIATLTKDFSWDGQSYHQEALLQLRQGWNPIKNNNLYDYLGLEADSTFKAPFWISHYPQGLWYLQTLFFDLTGNIETGKAVNILLMIALFLLTVPTVVKVLNRRISAILLSLLVVFNPVLTSQVFTFYNDGTIYLLVTSLVVLSLAWFFEADKWANYLPSIASVIVLLIATKFTALGYALMIILLPLSLIVREALVAKDSKILWVKKYVIAYLVVITAVLVGVLFVGKSSYVNNLLHYGHPFYPLAGKGKVDIMSYNYVVGAEDFGRIEGLYISQMSEVSNQKKAPAQAKFPLSVKKTELRALASPDTRIGGFGPLFGASLILLVLGLTSVSVKLLKKEHRLLLLIGFILLISVLINPETWWARYVPQFWLLPILGLILFDQMENKRVKVLSWGLMLVLSINVTLSVVNQVIWQSHMQGCLTQQLTVMRQVEDLGIQFKSFHSNRNRLSDNEITYEESAVGEYAYHTRLVGSTTTVLTNDEQAFQELATLYRKSLHE